MRGELHQLASAVLAMGGFLAASLIAVGLLYGLARLIERRTRIDRPKMVPIEQIFGDVPAVPEGMKASAEMAGRGSGAEGADLQLATHSHSTSSVSHSERGAK